MATVKWIRERTGLSAPTIGTALDGLTDLGIVREVTGRKRNRVFSYARYIAILNDETTTPVQAT